jgi:hypothetical protein
MKEIVNLSPTRPISRHYQKADTGFQSGSGEIVKKTVLAPLRSAQIASRRDARPGQACPIGAARAYERAQELSFGVLPPLFDFNI